MKKIFLIGDPSIDWLVYYEPNQTPRRSNKQTKNLANNPMAIIHKLPGGVLLLKDFLKGVNNAGDQLITYPDQGIDDILKRVPIHTFAVVKSYDDKNPETMRVDQFLGYSRLNIEEKLHVDGRPTDADLIIIDDAGNEFRNDGNYWINDLNKEKPFKIIHKLNWPLKGNAPVKELVGKFSDRMIAVVNADDLREHGLEISRQLSWDKTIEDFFKTFPRDGSLEYLRKFSVIIIRFNLEATLVMLRLPENQEKSKSGEFDNYLFYIPSKFEGQIVDEIKGNMQGLTHAFIASLGMKLLSLLPEQPEKERQDDEIALFKINQFNILTAIIPAMEAATNLLQSGYHYPVNSSKIDYPLEQIFRQEPNSQNETGGIVQERKAGQNEDGENKIRFAGIADFMDEQRPYSLLEHLSLDKKIISSMAFNCIKEKEISYLDAAGAVSFFTSKIPVFKTGHFKTYDHEEIESFRSFNKLVIEYLYGKPAKPLSIAVFGPPGSGKSFGVKEITGSENLKDKIKVIETNLSQLQAYDDLVTIFHESRDINLSGKVSLIFFDEFDSSYNDKPLGWIKYFLAPMQDGTFKDGEKVHPLGKTIFVFAGGTKNSFEEFAKELDKKEGPNSKNSPTSGCDNTLQNKPAEESEDDRLQKLKALKIPDFISRLKGFINIKGIDKKNAINDAEKNTPEDTLYSLRRAIVLKGILNRTYENLADLQGNINIDDELLNALLQIDKFNYGARSLEAIITMSDLANERSFKKSNLPSDSLLKMLINVDEFKELRRPIKELPVESFEVIAEKIRETIHKRWYERELAKGKKSVKETLKEWDDLPDEAKNSNLRQAADIPRKLRELGYTMIPNTDPDAPAFKFDPDEIEKMAEMEHERWNEEKLLTGWTYGKIRNDKLYIHDCLLPWHKLSKEIKDYDYDAVEDIPIILKSVGLEVVPIEDDH